MRASTKDDLKRQEVSQAVIIAENFNQKLSPLTNNDPLILLPVVNKTLLNYILQTLEESRIQESFVFCCSHSQLIRNYVSSSQWSSGQSSMSVSVISSASFMSMGDVMRELDSKALIRSDFVLVNGGVISTFPIMSILEQHRQLRQVDKNCAITLVYRKASPKHSIKCKEQLFAVAVESTSNRIRYYQRINKIKSLQIPLEVFQENEKVTIHNNLLDCFLSICSPCVPPLFSDNFDYQTLDDFVKGLIVNEELLGNSMYIHVADSGYGANISNFYMYDAVSQDIMSRWTYPNVPDLFEFSKHKLSYSRYNVYKEPDVEIGMNCKLLQNVAIGRKTDIGKNSVVTNSVIGRNCVIGANVTISNSYIWNDVTIGDGCILNTCILADKVKLHYKVTVSQGCVLGSEVVIGEAITVPPLTKLQAQDPCEEDSFGEEEFKEENIVKEQKTCDVSLVGAQGHGYVCQLQSESDVEEEDDILEDIWGQTQDNSFSDEEETMSSSSQILSACDAEDSEGLGDDYDDEATSFYTEVLESLQRGIEEKVKSENMILEINSSKHAYNITMREVNTLVVKALLKMPLETAESISTPQQYFAAIKTSLTFFQPLISNYIRSADSQLDCLSSVQEFMKSHDDLSPAVIKVLHFWYDKDILSESAIIKWFKNLIGQEDEKVKKQAAAFVKWLQEADEESSED